MFRVVIAGSRSFSDFDLLVEKCDFYLQNKSDVCIVSGTANGADVLGERYAMLRGYKIMRFPADWNTHGKKAGYIRNCQMADNADAVIAFHVSSSRGTQHMIDIAKSRKIPCRVVIL